MSNLAGLWFDLLGAAGRFNQSLLAVSRPMAMRRSARETKKPEYYLGSQETIGKSSQSEYEEENRHGNKVSSDSEDHLSKRRKRDEAPPREEKKANKAASVPTSHGQKSTLFGMVFFILFFTLSLIFRLFDLLLHS